MKKNNLIRFVQSLVILPVVFLGVHNVGISQNVLSKKLNIESEAVSGVLALNEDAEKEIAEQKIKEKKAELIDAYFRKYDMPLEGMGMKMVLEAEKNGLDWRLLPAISVRESTGGKNDCKKNKYNAFGWGSCKIGFNSNEEAVETVARNLGGRNPQTAKYYKDKNIKQILRAYNPPSIVPRYAEQVISIMNSIGQEDITTIQDESKSSFDPLVQKG